MPFLMDLHLGGNEADVFLDFGLGLGLGLGFLGLLGRL